MKKATSKNSKTNILSCEVKPLKMPETRSGLIWFVIFTLFCATVYILRSVILPFAVGIVLGYVFNPMARRFEKWGMSRIWATVAVFLVVIIIAVPALILLFGVIDAQLTTFVEAVPRYIAAMTEHLEPVLANLQDRFPDLETQNIKNILRNNITGGLQFGGKLVKGIISNGFAFVNLLSMLVITPVVAFYMLRDWDVFVAKVDALLPRQSKKEIREQFQKIDSALSGFIRGQLSVCVILGLYYSLGLKLVGLELGLLVGFLSGIISFIPYVGSITGFVLSIILALAQFGDITKVLEVVLVFGVGQFAEGNFLTPKLVGEHVGLHPVWVMFALLAGGALMGFLGMMIAMPVAAIIGVLSRYVLENYKQSKLYLD